MVQESLLYHSIIIKILFGFLLINLFIPLLFEKNSISAIKAVRISSFIYSALITMVIFTGMILYMLGAVPWNLEMSLMVLSFFLLSAIEIVRTRKLKELWIVEQSMVATSSKYILLELVIVGATILMMVVGI